jgi:hypothetical protein
MRLGPQVPQVEAEVDLMVVEAAAEVDRMVAEVDRMVAEAAADFMAARWAAVLATPAA